MRIIRSSAAALVVATSLVGAGAWADTGGSTTNQQNQGQSGSSGQQGGSTGQEGSGSQQGSQQGGAQQGTQQQGTQKGVTEEQGEQGQHGQQATGKKLSAEDHKFFRDAYSDATAEAAIGEMASKKGTSAQIQQLGQKLASDSSRQLSDLKDFAQKNGVQVPTGMESQYQTEVARLSKLEGRSFDQAFLSHVRSREQKVLTEMQKEAKSGKNADLKSYAKNEQSTVRSHVDQARSIGVTAPQPPATKQQQQQQQQESPQQQNQETQPKSNQNQGWPQQ